MDKLVGEFLRFARPAPLAVKLVNLNDIIESVASLIGNQAASQAVMIEKRVEKNLSKVSVDEEQIKQVLLNLGINSLQSMPKGNKLVFRTFGADKFCVIEVEDTGSGIDEKIMPKIFDPFFTTKEKGVGLGLSVAYKIVKQHEGILSVFENDGKM